MTKRIDIGPIPHLVPITDEDAAKVVDPMQARRGFACKYRVLSKRVACFYHDALTTNQEVRKEDVVRCIAFIEEYLDKIPKEFDLAMPALQQGKRYVLYISGTGLHPEPQDCTGGVVGAANEYVMVLHPDVIRNIASVGQTTVIHELGHGFFWVPWKRIWMEESLNEFLVWYFLPDYQAFYDKAVTAVFRRSWVHPLSEANSADRRYDVAVFWAYVAHAFGAKAVGRIANNAFKGQDGSGHALDALAAFVQVPVAKLAVDWAAACMCPDFLWSRPDQSKAKDAAFKYLGGRSHKRANLSWDVKTFDWPQVPTRTELYGFEVSNVIRAGTTSLPELAKLDPAKWAVRYVTLAGSVHEGVPQAEQSYRVMLVRVAA
jgi:hypothetical protein